MHHETRNLLADHCWQLAQRLQNLGCLLAKDSEVADRRAFFASTLLDQDAHHAMAEVQRHLSPVEVKAA